MALSKIEGVEALTDVTGFGLVGHLSEICLGSHVKAQLNYAAIPRLERVEHYQEQGCIPGGTHRNFDSYSHLLSDITEQEKELVCDPQTSGGLLIAVRDSACEAVETILSQQNLVVAQIGQLVDSEHQDKVIELV